MDDALRFRLLVESVPDHGIFLLDPAGRVASWNAGAQRIAGWSAEEIVGQHFSVLSPPEEDAAGELELAAEQGRLEREGSLVRKDGTRFRATVVITPMFDERHRSQGFGVVAREVPGARPAGEPPREERFRRLVQSVQDYGIFMLDPEGRISSWNAGAERIKGWSAEEIIGQHFSVFYPPEDVAAGKPVRELEIAVEQGRLEDEGWRVRKDGRRFWANVVITALFDEQHRLRGFGKVTRDTTERRMAEEALRASEERFRLLVQSVQDYGIFMLDPEGRISSWNAGAERIKGWSAEEIIGQHFSVFYPPEDVAAGKPARELEIAVEQGRLEDEGWRVRKDGTRFWANVVITALFDDRHRLHGFGKVTRDMTERRNAEQALRERRRLVGHLVDAQEVERRRIAWDVHDESIQSMVAVGMRLQLLASRLPEPHASALAGLDESVSAAIARLRGLVSRLRPPELDRHGLVEAVSGYADEVAGRWGLAHSVRADLTAEPSPEVAITVYRICQEALSNVHKHARATRVDLTLSTVDNGTLVRIADDGIGTPGEDAGAGHFGLVEMHERAEAAHGWLSVTSTPGRGTVVEFWLPTLPDVTELEP
ncbi:PAS domain S-box protein [Amycolatopsis sp. cmx-4-68]|uniref:PAS domain-containing sensor histidine kinase n=1 Tax=Amycolatopsis sp. cmx-4-68 TaxID=2790938 RepID=UPI003978599B